MIRHRVILRWTMIAAPILVQSLIPLCSGLIGGPVGRGHIAANRGPGTGISRFAHRMAIRRATRSRNTARETMTPMNNMPMRMPMNNMPMRMPMNMPMNMPMRMPTATQTTTTQLSLHPTAGASLALIGSSLFGMQLSRRFPNGGILGTLLSAAFCGNILTRWIPNRHPLYDLCFTLFLPVSLTLMLLAYRPPDATRTSPMPKTNTRSPNSISACIRRVATPFLIASLSSLLGCWLSFRCALAFRWFQEPSTVLLAGPTALGGNGKTADLLARMTMGCMSASYVGGTVNFMSTAQIVGAPADLLGSLVTADLFTMAIYFTFLSSSLDWEWLVSKFSNAYHRYAKGGKEQDESIAKDTTRHEASKPKGTDLDPRETTILSSSVPSDRNFVSLASIPLLTAAFLIVQVANRVQDMVGNVVPGTACALIAVVAPLLNSLVQSKDFWVPFSEAASAWSDFFFLSFFASIGVAANLSSALAMGPACLLFSTIALSTHVIGTVVGSLLWKRLMLILPGNSRKDPPPSLDLEDVWIASNAAIGGPATAAAFCGQMKKSDPEKLQGRTISATVWGVVGYAIGTMVGVGIYRMV